MSEKLSEKHLTFGESKKYLSEEHVRLLIDTFDKVYKDICDFFNGGEIRPVEYVIDPDYDGVAYTTWRKVVLNPRWLEQHPWDIDCMTHELIHVAQNYKGVECPFWVCEGLADYGRAKFGIYNKEGGWALPKYSDKQKYTDGYRVTAAFFLWIEENIDPTLPKDLNDTVKAGKYSDDYFKNKTGYTIDELWQKYAEASKAKESAST